MKSIYPPGAFPCGDPSVSETTGCARCTTPHGADSEPHMTPYHGCATIDGQHDPCNAIFALCESCWAALTPDQRWPYYAALLGYQAAQFIMHGQPLPPAYVAARVCDAVLYGLK